MTSPIRLASWIVGAASVALPAMYFVVQRQSLQMRAEAQEGLNCGMSALAIVLLSVGGAALLSAVAALLNGIALRRQTHQRPVARYIELVILAAPLLAAITAALGAAIA